MSTDVLFLFCPATPPSLRGTDTGTFPQVRPWGGWGSNPRPADYEKYGPELWVRCLHGYHGVVALVTLIAPFARMTRSTNRSTPYHGGHRMPATERYRRPASRRVPRARRHETPESGSSPGLVPVIIRVHSWREPRAHWVLQPPGVGLPDRACRLFSSVQVKAF